MFPKEACNFYQLFDSLPKGNWFEKFPPNPGRREYSRIYAPEIISKD